LPVFNKARELWELNQRDYHLPLSKIQKLYLGTYLILSDYSKGKFPPAFPDRQKAYEAEIKYIYSIPGVKPEDMTDYWMRKPFYGDPSGRQYFSDYLQMTGYFQKLGIQPPKKLLELGCGTGWMAEFMSMMKFDVLGTSISPPEIESAQLRIKAMKVKHLDPKLKFEAIPMESVDQVIGRHGLFDCVYAYEALHHAFDWREAIQASGRCLKPGGWLILANEPNALHIYISYRISKLTRTHEIGFTYSELSRHLRKAGFRNIKRLRNRVDFFVKPHWIAAQK
jgi:2-polyprenyl-3-methyl-5-hydroxy-6-metoxy-1,4-benzoquinol methylase